LLRALKLTLGSLRKRGVVATAGVLATSAVDLWYDWRRGTRTAGWVDLDAFSIASPNRERGRAYQATPAFAFRRLLQTVSIPRDAGFVDFGCGKGRAVLLAAESGFARAVGIEFAPELAAEARRNAERWLSASGQVREIRIVEGDVLDYPIERRDSVFFLFNPFDGVMLDRVLDRIEASLEALPRHAWIIYHNPLESERIHARRRFELVARHTFWGNEFSVYRSTP
jgi:SAM-dependent methyltransferase